MWEACLGKGRYSCGLKDKQVGEKGQALETEGTAQPEVLRQAEPK